MIAEPKTLVRRAVVCALLAALAGCARTTEAFGGETNWLLCEDDDDCASGFACTDGECVPKSDLESAGQTSTPTSIARAGDDMNPDPLLLALLWTPEDLEQRTEPSGLCGEGSNTQFAGQVAQPIDVEVSLPMVVDISALPPPPDEALVTAPSGHAGAWTLGHLVLFRDGNANGLLDPRDLEHDSPDEIVGTSGDWALAFAPTPGATSYVIYYSDERLPEYAPTIEAGYNVFRDVADSLGDTRTAVPLDTLIPVPLRSEPNVQTMNCEELCFAQDEDFRCPASAAQLPDGGTFECYPGASSWSRPRCDGCFCFTAVCEYDGEPCSTE
jgi:hypothetical protein